MLKVSFALVFLLSAGVSAMATTQQRISIEVLDETHVVLNDSAGKAIGGLSFANEEADNIAAALEPGKHICDAVLGSHATFTEYNMVDGHIVSIEPGLGETYTVFRLSNCK